MTLDERAALGAELSVLRRKVEKRRDEPGFAANVREMDSRIVKIEALLVVVEPEPALPQESPPEMSEPAEPEPTTGEDSLPGAE